MIEVIVIATVQYLVLTTLDGRTIHVNPAHIVSTTTTKGKLVTDAVQCVIYTTDGRIITIAETCESLKMRLEQLK